MPLWASFGPYISVGRQRTICKGLVLEAQNLCCVVNSAASIAKKATRVKFKFRLFNMLVQLLD